MRGKARPRTIWQKRSGITPAYAGKRASASPAPSVHWDHPRVCGEKGRITRGRTTHQGSPPRMRGKVYEYVHDKLRLGITPAYAGKSLQCLVLDGVVWDHPRVCGEKTKITNIIRRATGSPPRMRGKAGEVTPQAPCKRITPAYAGKSRFPERKSGEHEDHPRVCGEK